MISSVTGFIDKVLSERANSTQLVTYRGHSNQSFKLIPSIFREFYNHQNEHIFVQELIAAYPDDFAADKSALETLVRMQHFACPTRLLDVSFNPLVALYFACEEVHSKNTHGNVIAIYSKKTSLKYFDSDTVSCLANLSKMAPDLKSRIEITQEKEEFNDGLAARRLTHFIRQEKFGFEADIEPRDLSKIVLVKPKQNNRRILAQAGAFFVFGLTEELSIDHVDHIQNILIAQECKGKIRDQLDRLGINEKTLFPDIERAARYLKEDVVHVAMREMLE